MLTLLKFYKGELTYEEVLENKSFIDDFFIFILSDKDSVDKNYD